ncbi:MAG: (Fe-S) protein, partial [Methylococcaceae bacterium]|nr:(Fe-S) protein [Methylococcaceae bacterium]
MADQDSTVSVPMADCSLCPFRGKTLLMGRCMPGDTCVFVESGRQIDRFFRINPGFAEHYLQDVFWERRAIAVRYAPQKALTKLIYDEDEVVRRAVAYRLPQAQLNQLIDDPDREVRMTVADRIAIEELEKLANDKDYIVRLTVAKRLPVGRLFRFTQDKDAEVRKAVAERLPEVSLGLMIHDDSPDVRRIIAERMGPSDAVTLLN